MYARCRKSTPCGGAPPASTSTPGREAGGRDEVVAQPVHEGLRRREAVVVGARDDHLAVVPGRVDVAAERWRGGSSRPRGRRRSPVRSRPTAASTSPSSTEPSRFVTSTIEGATAPGPTALLEHVEAVHRLRRARDAVRRAGRQLQRERRQRRRDQHRRAGGEEDDRPPHDRAGEPRPQPLVRIERLAGKDPLARHAAAAVEREQRRLQRRGRGDRDDRDQEAGDPHHPHERQRHRDEQREPERDREPGEHDGAAGRLHRPDDGGVLVVGRGELLAEAVDDEQRVVDGDARGRSAARGS